MIHTSPEMYLCFTASHTATTACGLRVRYAFQNGADGGKAHGTSLKMCKSVGLCPLNHADLRCYIGHCLMLLVSGCNSLVAAFKV